METLSLYIPTDRRHALTTGQPLPERSNGAVLFADISGFTPLTAALVQERGPRRGAEELTRRLNDVFGALHAEVLRYGGSIISFGGDSITCWFDQRAPGQAEPDDAPAAQQAAARRALTCALELQRVMGRFSGLATPGGTAVALRLKVGVAAGPCRRLLVGHPRIQVCEVLAGAIMDRVAAAEQVAQRGEVVASAELAELLGEQLQPEEWRSDDQGRRFAVVLALRTRAEATPWPALAAVDTEVARDWLLGPIYGRLARGEAAFLGELRQAVPLFLRFASLDYDHDQQAGPLLDAFIRWVQQLLARYEGYLLQLSIGDKGSHIIVIFGAPVAHEDDALRAVAAALELRQLPAELSAIGPVRIGISQGRVYAGAYGAADRGTYGVLGTEVNLAVRTMDQAEPGQILVTAQVVGSLNQNYDLADLGLRQIKGHPEPLPIYAVQGRRSSASSVTPKRQPVALVNRLAERAVFARSLEALRAGQRGTLLIEGEAGIGKSRLVAELLAQAGAAGLLALTGEGDAIERATPYYPLRALFSQLLRPPGQPEDLASGDRQIWRSHLLDLLERALPDLVRMAPLITAVLPLELPDNEVTAQMTGEVRAINTNDLLVSLLVERARREPLVIVLEDGHWLDSASWTVAQLLGSQVAPLLLAVATRPLGEPPPTGYALLRQSGSTQRMLVEALAATEVDELVCQRLGVRQLPKPVSDLIRAKAEGHPFFSEELAYALRDAGLIRVIGDQCELAPGVRDLHAFDFPDTIEGVITSRVDRLPPTQQLTLKVASVIGRVFAYSTLEAIYPVASDLPALIEQLNALNRLDITKTESSDPELTYIFKHVSAQEAVYSLLLFAQRQQLHHGVAEWYESTHTDNLAPFYRFLAYHWRLAGRSSKAIDYLEQAGNQALRSGAYLEALRCFEEILELAAEVPPGPGGEPAFSPARQASWRWKLGESHFRLGQFAPGRAHAEQAMAWFDQAMPSGGRGLLASLLRQIGQQARHRLLPADRVLLPDPDARTRRLAAVGIYQSLSQIYYATKAQGLSIYAALRQVNLAEQAGPSLELAQAYSVLNIILGLFGLHGVARSYGRRAMLVAAQLPDQPYVLANVLHRISVYHVGAAQLSQARNDLRQAMETYQYFGDRAAWRDCLVILLAAETGLGQFERVLQLIDQIPAALSEDDRALHHYWGLQRRASVALLQDQLPAAISLLERAEGFLGRGNEEPVEVSYYGLLALAQLRQGASAPAREAAEQALRLIGRTRGVPMVVSAIDGYSGAAETLLLLWEQAQRTGQPTAELQQLARRACGYLQMFRRFLPYGTPAAWLYQGWLHQLEGRPAQAMTAWISGLAAAERYGMPHEQGQLHYAIGRSLSPSDPLRRVHLTLARELFSQLEAHYHVRLVDAALNEAVGLAH